jgi:hypothetical protein
LGTMSRTGSTGKGFIQGLLGMMWRIGLGGEGRTYWDTRKKVS